MTQPGSRSSKVQFAYDAIKAGVMDGTYAAGERLVLDQLARELMVSAVPVREAIRQLEAEGWVVFERNVGAQVATIDLKQYRDVMESLAVLEGYATACAAPHIDEARLAEARRINNRLRDALSDFDPGTFTELNHEFHALLCWPAANPHVLSLLDREWQRMSVVRRSIFKLTPSRAHYSVVEHDALLHLIESGASASIIEQYARDHKLNTMRSVPGAATVDASAKSSMPVPID